jgi:hypothetical protein
MQKECINITHLPLFLFQQITLVCRSYDSGTAEINWYSK